MTRRFAFRGRRNPMCISCCTAGVVVTYAIGSGSCLCDVAVSPGQVRTYHLLLGVSAVVIVYLRNTPTKRAFLSRFRWAFQT